MVEVDGDYCTNLQQKCLDPGYNDPNARCFQYEEPSKCIGKLVHKHFSIDRYEWPNKRGQKPPVMITWYESQNLCKSVGKRLCTDTEWTLACEGDERTPYPYGYARDATKCNIDHNTLMPNEKLFRYPGPVRDAELLRVDQRVASGTMPGCVTKSGIHDMTGNIDEWVLNEGGYSDKVPYISGLKGGYWGPVRNRCRPMTVAHGPSYSYYQQGVRCCMTM